MSDESVQAPMTIAQAMEVVREYETASLHDRVHKLFSPYINAKGVISGYNLALKKAAEIAHKESSDNFNWKIEKEIKKLIIQPGGKV